MSDNSLNWSSCMNWKADGCYHVGTVESMNSNNTLCCYIEDSSTFYFDENNHSADSSWNNKRWRVLAYVTKDIILAGKSYPYTREEFSKTIIDTLKKLAKENLNWNYSFGPELYKDMKYVNSEYPLMRSRSFITTGTTKKHNILFDTKGMYNDILNNHNYNFWCYRNKVNQNKVISLSGKCPCLSCGEPVIELNECVYYDDYNDRYLNTANVICEPCLEGLRCSICKASCPTQKLYKIYKDNKTMSVCKYCFDTFIKICPCCGKPFLLNSALHTPIYIKEDADLFEKNQENNNYYVNHNLFYYHSFNHKDKNIFMCMGCFKTKYIETMEILQGNDELLPVFKEYPGDQFLYANLKNWTYDETVNLREQADCNFCKIARSAATGKRYDREIILENFLK